MEEERSGIGRGVAINSLLFIECKSASMYSGSKDWIRSSILSYRLLIILA
jgi:hypothetical protein